MSIINEILLAVLMILGVVALTTHIFMQFFSDEVVRKGYSSYYTYKCGICTFSATCKDADAHDNVMYEHNESIHGVSIPKPRIVKEDW